MYRAQNDNKTSGLVLRIVSVAQNIFKDKMKQQWANAVGFFRFRATNSDGILA